MFPLVAFFRRSFFLAFARFCNLSRTGRKSQFKVLQVAFGTAVHGMSGIHTLPVEELMCEYWFKSNEGDMKLPCTPDGVTLASSARSKNTTLPVPFPPRV